MKEGKFELGDIKVTRLSKLYDISSFDCGDSDLNEFLKEDSFRYQGRKIANTFLITYKEKVIGFFSLCTDALKLDVTEKSYYRLSKKPLPEYPAMKIARLAVDKSCQKKQLGRLIINIAVGFIKYQISDVVGCRFITVDSYSGAVGFYTKFGFAVNEHKKYKKKESYVSMRFDLLNPPK